MKTNYIKTKVAVSLVVMISISACSGAKKVSSDYVLRESSPEVKQEWVKNFAEFKRNNEGKGISYFLGESGDVNDRVSGCDVASLTGKKRIAQFVAEFVTSKVSIAKSGQLMSDKTDYRDQRLGGHFTDQLASKSIAFLSGVKEYDQYWEERDYSIMSGKSRLYQCTVVVQIDDRSLALAIKRVAERTPETIDDVEAKALAKESLKNIDQEFESFLKTKR